MAEYLYKTKGNSSSHNKPRVYFTCHPDDFLRYFEQICEDIFRTHDCAIYYTEDMNEIIPDEDKPTDLGSMNLIAVPVTFRLLSTPNRAMDDDLAYAKEKHIAILPIMMEAGIDELYSLPEKFGELQYINPYSHDLTEISYEEKLKKYLESVLISEETAKRIRAAFDAYIFLSYRKKDRKHANELMRLIHSKPMFRDIAIWYDEFLTPGESFNENIRRMMKESKLFTLLVTPNLLEKPGGKPNYVMEHEYPDARDSGMDILPAEMEETDRNALSTEYADIPECVKTSDGDAFGERLVYTLGKIAREENNDDPEHNYLIGLAYLEGIDVETDKERGIELITKAAQSGLLEAMKALYEMYSEGKNTALDYRKALVWAEKTAAYQKHKLGINHHDTLATLNNLSVTYSKNGNYKKALELQAEIYNLRCHIFGEENHYTLISMSNLAELYSELGDHNKALELKEKVYNQLCRLFGDEYLDTLTSLSSLAVTYGELGNHKKALELQKTVYSKQIRILGEEHPDTLTSLNNLAVTYGELGDHKKALELKEDIYIKFSRIFGEEHPGTLTALSNLAVTYGNNGDYKKEAELHENVYTKRSRILGKEHPSTLTSMNNLAVTYSKLGDHNKALELEEKIYNKQIRILGEEHPYTLKSLNNLAVTYGKLGNHKKALELKEKAYDKLCRTFGEEHPNTLTALNNLAVTYIELGELNTALELKDKEYKLLCRNFGDEHNEALTALGNLAELYSKTGDHNKALELREKLYNQLCRLLGEEHPDTLTALFNLSVTYGKLGDHKKETELQDKVYNQLNYVLG